MDTIPLIGYAEKLSGRTGDTIEFKVSSASQEPFHANLVRIICTDPNPAGPGLIEEEVDIDFGGLFPLGSPEDIHVLASSEGHDDTFVLVPEELFTHLTTWPGEPIDKLIRADMVYQKSDNGGQLFATGSITFCGSLLRNNGENNISKLVLNVLNRFLE